MPTASQLAFASVKGVSLASLGSAIPKFFSLIIVTFAIAMGLGIDIFMIFILSLIFIFIITKRFGDMIFGPDGLNLGNSNTLSIIFALMVTFAVMPFILPILLVKTILAGIAFLILIIIAGEWFAHVTRMKHFSALLTAILVYFFINWMLYYPLSPTEVAVLKQAYALAPARHIPGLGVEETDIVTCMTQVGDKKITLFNFMVWVVAGGTCSDYQRVAAGNVTINERIFGLMVLIFQWAAAGYAWYYVCKRAAMPSPLSGRRQQQGGGRGGTI